MAEQQEQLEMEVEVDTEVEVEASEEQSDQENVEIVEEDQFDKAQSSTQKRIDRLTKKMRDAQRREEEAVNYAKQVQEEATQLKQRFSALDSNYVSEYTNRVQTQMEQTEKELARAMELGDTTAVVEANKKMIALSAENDRANQAKVAQERQQQQAQQQVQQQPVAPQQQQAVQQQQIKRPDPKAQDWAARNDWFGQDEAKTFAAFGIHKKLVEDEGFDPTSDEYYTELDRRISDTFGGNAKSASKRPAQTVAGVSRSNSGRSSGKKVRLTPSQVAIAKKLGVPLEEYAKYVKE
tara:strand:+ start:13 stop:894 length:882 start_codon:yes stop_codon:yes gene_type:complete